MNNFWKWVFKKLILDPMDLLFYKTTLMARAPTLQNGKATSQFQKALQ